jgi:signal transduction histidine kinase
MLRTALEGLAARTPLQTELRYHDGAAGAPSVEAALFYVCSEALANVAKHARASHVGIDVRRLDDGLQLIVTDNGRGGADPSGPGLTGLADRLAAHGGRLRVDSPPGAGTTLTATVRR